ncbi:hypothetical protein CDL15_Pgr007474 [Punica granatum]|uniref:Uncharacterized protein n=1 Tax=Punica granatum TaxID=22663 RepID=A0A218X9Q9_PUNGR|nr:hypothetical protein CDL15_Pgr007474 [Punica granatum]
MKASRLRTALLIFLLAMAGCQLPSSEARDPLRSRDYLVKLPDSKLVFQILPKGGHVPPSAPSPRHNAPSLLPTDAPNLAGALGTAV